jgi:citrate lyase subunit beta/citryl-CoA lyase
VHAHRSLLFIPAQKSGWIAKAHQTKADAIILDLEDALPDDLKAPTRPTVAASIRTVAGNGTPCFVRTNALDTGMFFEDVDAAACAELTGLVLSKVETADDIRVIDRYLGDVESRRGIANGQIGLVVVAETAECMRSAYDVCRASKRVWSICGGTTPGGDINRALGYKWTREGMETLFARSKIILDARAAGIAHPISGIWTEIEDLDGLRAHALKNRQLGYRGELIIHPSHVPVVNEVYSPSPDEIEYAQGVHTAMAEAERAGSAGIRFRGDLIDYAHVRSARDTLALAERFAATHATAAHMSATHTSERRA